MVETAPVPTPFLPRGFTGLAPGTPATEPAPIPTAAAAGTVRATFPLQSVFDGLNGYRATLGLEALQPAAPLDQVAGDRAVRLAAERGLRHLDPTTAFLQALGYHGRLAEHVMALRSDLPDPAGSALQAMLSDPDHRADLLEPELGFLGQGAASDGSWWYLVQVLAESGPGG